MSEKIETVAQLTVEIDIKKKEIKDLKKKLKVLKKIFDLQQSL